MMSKLSENMWKHIAGIVLIFSFIAALTVVPGCTEGCAPEVENEDSPVPAEPSGGGDEQDEEEEEEGEEGGAEPLPLETEDEQ